MPGFGVKVTPKGRKVFLVMYRLAGAGSRLRKYTIGPYGRVTLPMAKAQAQKIFAARLDGRDPAEEKRQSRRRLVVDRVDDLVETFIREHVAKIGTNRRITSLLRRDVIPYWGAKSIHEIKKRDVSDLISLIAQRNAHASHRLLKTLKTLFRWCVGRAVIDFSPAEGISSPYREVSRDRVLTDEELAAVILSARRMPPPYGRIVEFLALTGQRREEVAQLKWDELDEKTRTWTIPGSRTKNKKAHIVHLSTPAWKVIEACSGSHTSSEPRRENGSSASEEKSAPSTSCAGSISAKIRKYIVLRPEAVIATALWTMTAWAHEGATHSPILAAISVEDAHTITIGAFEAFVTSARLHGVTLRMERAKWRRRRRLRENLRPWSCGR